MKRILEKIVIVCMAVLCVCVFPVSLVRKGENVESAMSGNFGKTDYTVRELKQTFTAQTAYLEEIALDVGISDQGSGDIRVSLKDEKRQRVIREELIPAQAAGNESYTFVPVKKWLRKGGEYSVTVTAEGMEGIMAIYTLVPEEAAPGNQALYLDGETIDGQAVIRYTYAFPLNIKNVLCIWAFILMIGLSVLELLKGQETAGSLPFVRRAGELLNRFQIPFLLLELAVILFLVIRIGRNEAVDWDEAYTWWITTENTVPEMFKATAADVHPPLYYLLVMAAMAIFGENIFVAKLVSVAGMAATCLLGITLVRKRWGVKAASLFLLAAGLGTQMIYYNTNVRMYSWMIFFVMAAALLAYEILQNNGTKWWILFVLASLGGVYTQYFAVIPLAFIYLFLLVWFVFKDRGQLKKWAICSIATVAGYLPWLTVVLSMLKSDYTGAQKENIGSAFPELCSWAFENNIKFSRYMPAVLFAVAAVWLVISWKKFENKERIFILLTGTLFFVSYRVCILFAAYMGHFWTNRYLVDVLLFVWLFVIIFLSKRGVIVWGASFIWLGIFVLSSYTVIQAWELDTILWTEQAKQVLEQVQDEEKIVYNFTSYDMIYQYWLPDAEFIWYEDVDFTEMGDEFYLIAWGGGDFEHILYERGVLEKQILGTMRLENGVAGVELWKITVNLPDGFP